LTGSLTLVRQRVDAFGVSEPEIRIAGNDPPQLEVNLPGVENADDAAEQVGSTAQLFLYDWETNLLDEDCQTNATEPDAGLSPITGLFRAVQQASKCPAKDFRGSVAADAPRTYAFRANNQPLADGATFESEADARDSLSPQERRGAKFLTVKPGVLVLRDSKPDPTDAQPNPRAPDRWWVLQDNPALSGTDIRDPEQNFDEQGGNAPIVSFNFTDRGREAFQNTTRAIAIRGQDNAPPGLDRNSAANVSHKFAIALDDELVSRPYINFIENPDGIDGVNGAQISGGFTIDTAQNLANLLKIGALPLRLEVISRSQVSSTLGAQALDQGVAAGIGGFVIVAVFLLLFYRVLG
jgi:SecD/SecF fusion protein